MEQEKEVVTSRLSIEKELNKKVIIAATMENMSKNEFINSVLAEKTKDIISKNRLGEEGY